VGLKESSEVLCVQKLEVGWTNGGETCLRVDSGLFIVQALEENKDKNSVLERGAGLREQVTSIYYTEGVQVPERLWERC